jgi:hypothetical protein
MEAWIVDEQTKGLGSASLRKVEVDPEKVRKELAKLKELLPQDMDRDDGTLQRWNMDEVELTVVISAEGGIQLIGSATVTVTGGIRVVFKRRA